MANISESRGRILLALDNSGSLREQYLKLRPELKGALIFVSSPPGRPESAFLKINDPVGNFKRIQKRVSEGYLIRTRADSDLREGRANDVHRRERAFGSGAQFISSDFPEPRKKMSNYSVKWKGGQVGRLNPVKYKVKDKPQSRTG